MTLNDLEYPKDGSLVNLSRFRPATHNLRVIFTKIAEDRPRQSAYEILLALKADFSSPSHGVGPLSPRFAIPKVRYPQRKITNQGPRVRVRVRVRLRLRLRLRVRVRVRVSVRLRVRVRIRLRVRVRVEGLGTYKTTDI